MITMIEPEPGGEAEGVLRVELSVPFAPDELRSLRDWFATNGWGVEVDQIDDFFAGKDWQG